MRSYTYWMRYYTHWTRSYSNLMCSYSHWMPSYSAFRSNQSELNQTICSYIEKSRRQSQAFFDFRVNTCQIMTASGHSLDKRNHFQTASRGFSRRKVLHSWFFLRYSFNKWLTSLSMNEMCGKYSFRSHLRIPLCIDDELSISAPPTE